MTDKTFVDGVPFSAADMNTYGAHTGGAWNSWTPVVTQSGSVTISLSRSSYIRVGRLIIFEAVATVTGAGVASNAIVLTLPITSATLATNYSIVGQATIQDTSGPFIYGGPLIQASTTTARVANIASGLPQAYFGASNLVAALASGDIIAWSGMYEASAG